MEIVVDYVVECNFRAAGLSRGTGSGLPGSLLNRYRRGMPPSPHARRPATLASLAAELGVSRTTVSNAYNRPDQLSPQLRKRVLETAQRMGYPGPDPVARSLRTRKAGAVRVTKDVVTEQKKISVPVTRDEVRVELLDDDGAEEPEHDRRRIAPHPPGHRPGTEEAVVLMLPSTHSSTSVAVRATEGNTYRMYGLLPVRGTRRHAVGGRRVPLTGSSPYIW